jgi:drug/metabolite transporter (DMT)-like permease
VTQPARLPLQCAARRDAATVSPSKRIRATRIGVALLVLGTLLFAIADAITKWLTASYPVAQIASIRTGCGLVFVLGIAIATQRLAELRTRRLRLHALRSALVAAVILGFYYALGRIPMVEVEAIGHAAPIFVALLAPHVLGERVTGHHWAAIGIGFLGILIVLRPDPAHLDPAHLVMLGCAVVYSVLIMLARMLSATDSVLAINLYAYPLAFLATSALCAGRWVAPTPFDWMLFLAFSACATGSLFVFIAGLRFVDAALAATIDYVSLVWVSIIGYLGWREHPDVFTAAGIALIVGSGIYIVRHATRKLDESLVQTPEH